MPSRNVFAGAYLERAARLRSDAAWYGKILFLEERLSWLLSQGIQAQSITAVSFSRPSSGRPCAQPPRRGPS